MTDTRRSTTSTAEPSTSDDVPDLDLEGRAPAQSGEYRALTSGPNGAPGRVKKPASAAQRPLRLRRSRDNIAAVRPEDTARASNATVPRLPDHLLDGEEPTRKMKAPELELDREGPMSRPGAPMPFVRLHTLDLDDWDEPDTLVAQKPRALAVPSPAFSHGAVHDPSQIVTTSVARVAEAGVKRPDPRAALAALAGFGEPPTSILGTPGYAIRVFARRRIVKRDLEQARRYRLGDVSPYEAALNSADVDAVRTGVFVIVAMAVTFAISAIALYTVLGGWIL